MYPKTCRLCLDSHDRDDVFFTQDEQFIAIHLDGLSRVFAEQHALADLDVGLDALAVGVAPARTDGEDLALIRLLGGALGNHDARRGARFLIQTLNDHAIVQGAQTHSLFPPTWSLNWHSSKRSATELRV